MMYLYSHLLEHSHLLERRSHSALRGRGLEDPDLALQQYVETSGQQELNSYIGS
jgi:hypothetical protein